MPGLGQTPLETSKLASNRDVGSAVLEAFSRVLESRVAVFAGLIGDVLAVGTARDDGGGLVVGLADSAYLAWHAKVAKVAKDGEGKRT